MIEGWRAIPHGVQTPAVAAADETEAASAGGGAAEC